MLTNRTMRSSTYLTLCRIVVPQVPHVRKASRAVYWSGSAVVIEDRNPYLPTDNCQISIAPQGQTRSSWTIFRWASGNTKIKSMSIFEWKSAWPSPSWIWNVSPNTYGTLPDKLYLCQSHARPIISADLSHGSEEDTLRVIFGPSMGKYLVWRRLK